MERQKPMSLSYMMTVSPHVGGDAIYDRGHHPTFPDNHNPSPTSLGCSSDCLPDLPIPPLSDRQERSVDDDYSFDDGSKISTLAERRRRNKTASAKYRLNKNKQQVKMRQTIDQLNSQDRFMQQKLEELQLENFKVKSLNDHLRKEILSQRMLSRHSNNHHTHSHNRHREANVTLPYSYEYFKSMSP